MAYVLVQHLDPRHESMSAEILSGCTTLPVAEVRDGMPVEPDHVYVIPPNARMGIAQGLLRLSPRDRLPGPQRVIDQFFASLAADRKGRAIGIVLSGTAADGSQGLRAIKDAGGVALVQEPSSAKFPEMPRSAIASGAIDAVLTPERMARELVGISRRSRRGRAPAPGPEGDLRESREGLSRIYPLLREQCHMDFSFYKTSTILRRIERRRALLKLDSLDRYLEHLESSPEEVRALYRDILIHVTSFFRDPEAFEALKQNAFPALLRNRAPGTPVRVWAPGCSTGEEPYSLAISLLEFLGDRASDTPVQIFASDISEEAIARARSGVYPDAIEREISRERLDRFFTRVPGVGYKINKDVRDLCLFSRHDVTSDPPFAKLDLISCRNLLIYFSPTLQKHVIPIFHYALRPEGILWLGGSETVAGFKDLFSPLDGAQKFYVRKDARVQASAQFAPSTYQPGRQPMTVQRSPDFPKPIADHQRITDLALQSEFPGMLVSAEMEILQYRGEVGPFIQPAPGTASNHLFKMVRKELIPELRRALQAAAKGGKTVTRTGLTLRKGRGSRALSVRVIPVYPSEGEKRRFYLVLFEEGRAPAAPRGKTIEAKAAHGRAAGEVARLRRELAESLEYQGTLIEKYEATQENLTAANEELQSSNEELQSANEELETAKEELQSSNEELTTVNDELQNRNLEQSQLSNDLNNLLSSVEIAIIMLSSDRRIRRFTPLAGKVLNLISGDVGRPFSDLKLGFDAVDADFDLDRLVTEVLDTVTLREVELQDREGRWFRLQVRPYKTLDHRIDGVVLSFIDIDALKRSLEEIQRAKREAQGANRAKDLFLATLSHELRTPLTSILLWAQMLRSQSAEPEKVSKGLTIIAESAAIQNQLINDLLDVSRVIAGKVVIESQELNLSEVIEAAVESVAPAARARNIRILITGGRGIGTVMADRTRLQQVFWNLLSNAVKFSAPDSRVVVRSERFADEAGMKTQVLIHVEDSGKGIDQDFLREIFNPFSQEDSSSARLHGGLGLGLAIVKNLVELQGGTVEARNRSEGKGAVFTVRLPLKSEFKLAARSDPSARPDGATVALDGRWVLIVDNDARAGFALGEVLRSSGARADLVDSAAAALAFLEVGVPDVLVSEIALHGADGYALIRQIRSLPADRGGEIPALAVTVFAGHEDKERALAAGFDAHLAKPVEARRLAETIRDLAARSRR